MFIKNFQPTLVQQNGFLDVIANNTEKLTIKVMDTEGNTRKIINTIVLAGNQQFLLNMEDLSLGRYILNIFKKDVFLKSIRFEKL